MAVEQKLSVEKRTDVGTLGCRRMRRQGLIPGNLYGHGEESVAIVGAQEPVTALLTSGTHVFDLELDGRTETTFIRDVQWDTFGIHILHFDLLRVDREERVTVDVPTQLRGVAPGSLTGGILEQPLHSLQIDCPALEIPDSIEVRIGHLEIGQSIQVSDLELPDDLHVQNSPDAVIVHVVVAKVTEEEEETEELSETGAEPELVGRKAEEDDEEASDS